jgi:hypothetical protein
MKEKFQSNLVYLQQSKKIDELIFHNEELSQKLLLERKYLQEELYEEPF